MAGPRYFDDKPAQPTGPDYLRKPPTTEISTRHERETAKKSKGQRVPGSGNKLGKPGDVRGVGDLQELKATGKTDTRIKLSWLRKISHEALTQGRYPVVNMRFEKLEPPTPTDWVMIPADVYEDLKERAG